MSNLENYVNDHFDGILAFSDVHGDSEKFFKAMEYAKKENYFFMSMGDLVDRGDNPYEVVEAMYKSMYDGTGGLVIGNHDDKYRRFYSGNKVSFSADAKKTFIDVGKERESEFLRMYFEMQNFPMISAIHHKFGDITLVHAASHSDIWAENAKFGNEYKSRALYGEVTGEVHPDGYPIRYYTWVEEIPIGKTVIVGHDRKPIHNVAITEPLIMSNKNGGKAIFIDTGCGKGGFLTAAIIGTGKKGFSIVDYVNFK